MFDSEYSMNIEPISGYRSVEEQNKIYEKSLEEKVLERMAGIEKWFLEIKPHHCKEIFDVEIKV